MIFEFWQQHEIANCNNAGWLRGTAVERRSLTGELSLSHARSE